MKKMLFVFLALVVFLLLQGCYTIADKHLLFNADKTKAYTLEEVSSVKFFAPTYQYQRAKACDVKATLVKSSDFGSGYTKYEATDCKVMTKAMGWNKDLGTPTGPSIMQTGTGIAGAAIIADGIKDSGDSNSINNVNQQGQVQVQELTGGGSGGCRGNCGGGNNGNKFK